MFKYLKISQHGNNVGSSFFPSQTSLNVNRRKSLHLCNFTLCSLLVCVSKHRWTRNTQQTSEGKRKFRALGLDVRLHVRCRKHCITAALRDGSTREVTQSDLRDQSRRESLPRSELHLEDTAASASTWGISYLVHVPSGEVVINYLSASTLFQLSTWLISFCIFSPIHFLDHSQIARPCRVWNITILTYRCASWQRFMLKNKDQSVCCTSDRKTRLEAEQVRKGTREFKHLFWNRFLLSRPFKNKCL